MDGDYVAYRLSPLNAIFGIQPRPSYRRDRRCRIPRLPARAVARRGRGPQSRRRPKTTAVTTQAGSTMIARKTRTGGSLYLNRFVEGYPSAPEEARAALRAELTRFLASGGITPKLAVYEDKTVLPAKENAYMFGRTEVFFIDLPPAPAAVAGAKRTVEVRFREAGNYYNLRAASRAGEFLGSGTSMKVAVPPSGPVVIARTPIVLTALTDDPRLRRRYHLSHGTAAGADSPRQSRAPDGVLRAVGRSRAAVRPHSHGGGGRVSGPACTAAQLASRHMDRTGPGRGNGDGLVVGCLSPMTRY